MVMRISGAKAGELYSATSATVAVVVLERSDQLSLNFRGDHLDISVCACPDTVPAVEDIATGILKYLDVLMNAARESPRGQGRSVVSDLVSHVARHAGSLNSC